MISLIGKKIGMTSIFIKNYLIPVTIIKIKENIITCINKYTVQVTTGKKKKKYLNKCELGFYNKLNILPGEGLWEIPYIKNIHTYVGKIININLFKNVKKVDITGYSKGKGFCGTIKRWNFSSQDSSHGNSLSHRAPGSIGQNQSPGKVFKGKKMSGRLGNNRITLKFLKVIKIYNKKNILLIKGSIPGFNKSNIIIKSSINYN